MLIHMFTPTVLLREAWMSKTTLIPNLAMLTTVCFLEADLEMSLKASPYHLYKQSCRLLEVSENGK